MLWCYGLAGFLLLLGDAHGDEDPRSRVRRQNPTAPNGQVIDNIFNIPITAIKQTAAVAGLISPDNTQAINSVFKIPVSTLEAVGTFVKSMREQQNTEDIQRIRQERRDRLLALKEQKRQRKQEIQNQRLMQQQQRKRVVRHQHKDPFGLNSLNNLLLGYHRRPLSGGIHHHAGLGGGHGFHHGHKPHGVLGGHGGQVIPGNQPQHTYEVHENVDEDTTFSWHGVTAGFGSFFGSRPVSVSPAVKIENKIAPKERRPKYPKYPNDEASAQNKVMRIGDKPERTDDEPPLENKIAPRNARVIFVR